MKILVLGGTRFFGTHLVKSLIREGHDITVATRGKQDFPFKDKITFIATDRNKLEDLKNLAERGPFDIIYDQICMTAKNADDSCKAFNGKCKRYVLTSSGSVYNPADELILNESEFDQERYLINLEDKTPYDYQEAKRQSEAILSKQAAFPVAIVRFPFVTGIDDYSGRFKFHVERIKKGEEIYFPNLMAQIAFIQSHEAGQFLNFIGKSQATGAFNAVSSGNISLFDLVAMIEKLSGKRAQFAEVGTEANHSPYGFEKDFLMVNSKASALGFKFDHVISYLPELIKYFLG